MMVVDDSVWGISPGRPLEGIDGTDAFVELAAAFVELGGVELSWGSSLPTSEQSAGLHANEALRLPERGHWLVEPAHRDQRCPSGSCAAAHIREAFSESRRPRHLPRHRNRLGLSSGGISSRARRVVLLARVPRRGLSRGWGAGVVQLSQTPVQCTVRMKPGICFTFKNEKHVP